MIPAEYELIWHNGSALRIGIYGQSHTPRIGVRIEGLPKKVRDNIDSEYVERFCKRRAPGQNSWSTPRKEPDLPIFEMNGDAVEAYIENTNIRPHDYSELLRKPRPSHADFTARLKYGDSYKSSGGGAFSGRLTAPLCIAGAVCKKELEDKLGIRIYGHIKSIGCVKDDTILDANYKERDAFIKDMALVATKDFPVVNDVQGELMKDEILEVKEQLDSIGGQIEVVIDGVPGGVGGPLFEGVEGEIARLCFAVPAVKGVEFGNGFMAASLRATENNDSFVVDEGRAVLETNRSGGILGGITVGDAAPIVFDVAIKPTPSISAKQRTVDLDEMRDVELEIHGRHDPCIVPRAVPVIEACAAIAIYDKLLYEGKI